MIFENYISIHTVYEAKHCSRWVIITIQSIVNTSIDVILERNIFLVTQIVLKGTQTLFKCNVYGKKVHDPLIFLWGIIWLKCFS